MTPNNLDQFSPVKWEEFETVARPSDRGMRLKQFAVMCALALVSGVLFAVSH